METPSSRLYDLEQLYNQCSQDQNSLSQIYKSINYKIANPNTNLQCLSVEEIKTCLRPNRQGADDITTYTEEEINKIILKQSYILNSGLFDLGNIFPKIEVKSLDDEEFDSKILIIESLCKSNSSKSLRCLAKSSSSNEKSFRLIYLETVILNPTFRKDILYASTYIREVLRNCRFHKQYYGQLIGEYKLPTELFNNQVSECNIIGFPCPTLNLIFSICKSMISWLHSDRCNVAIVNCQASQGRSLLLVSCLLCMMKEYSHPGEALSHLCTLMALQEKDVMFASHQLYLAYFVNVKNSIQINLKKINIQKIFISGIPKANNVNLNTLFTPYIQIFDENTILYNSLKALSDNKVDKIQDYTQKDFAMSFDLNLTVDSEKDILIRCKNFHSKSVRYPVFRILFNTGFVYDQVLRFQKKDIEFSPFYEANSEFFIDFMFTFSEEEEKERSELKNTYKNLENSFNREKEIDAQKDENIQFIIHKGLKQYQENNSDFSIESHDDQNFSQEIKSDLKSDSETKEQDKISMNNEEELVFQKIAQQDNNEDEDLDDYFSKLENDQD